MNRTTFILGITLLVVALTMAVTITVRNAPQQSETTKNTLAEQQERSATRSTRASSFEQSMRSVRERSARNTQIRPKFDVGIPADALLSYPLDQQLELREQVVRVESKARQRLKRMTEEFALSGDQRRKIFPLLARSTPGYDPVMVVGGTSSPLDQTRSSADEEVYALLDSEQQQQLEDEEVDRQLWWQDVFTRLEKELVDSTGGAEITPTADGTVPEVIADPVDRSAPAARTGGNLLDLAE